jgi:hypothetical protein
MDALSFCGDLRSGDEVVAFDAPPHSCADDVRKSCSEAITLPPRCVSVHHSGQTPSLVQARPDGHSQMGGGGGAGGAGGGGGASVGGGGSWEQTRPSSRTVVILQAVKNRSESATRPTERRDASMGLPLREGSTGSEDRFPASGGAFSARSRQHDFPVPSRSVPASDRGRRHGKRSRINRQGGSLLFPTSLLAFASRGSSSALSRQRAEARPASGAARRCSSAAATLAAT